MCDIAWLRLREDVVQHCQTHDTLDERFVNVAGLSDVAEWDSLSQRDRISELVSVDEVEVREVNALSTISMLLIA